jgi:transcriptional regulator of heat shock response
MKLYELTANYAHVLEMAEEIGMEDLKDTLESIQDAIEDKAENIAKLIKCWEADAKAIKEEEQRLADRRKSLENKIASTKEYLQNQLEVSGLQKVKRPTITVAIQNNPPSVDIADESLIPTDYMIPQPHKIDKKAILLHLKEGITVDGCSIKQTRSVRIR